MTTTQQFTFTITANSLNEAQHGFNEAFRALVKYGEVTWQIKTVEGSK